MFTIYSKLRWFLWLGCTGIKQSLFFLCSDSCWDWVIPNDCLVICFLRCLLKSLWGNFPGKHERASLNQFWPPCSPVTSCEASREPRFITYLLQIPLASGVQLQDAFEWALEKSTAKLVFNPGLYLFLTSETVFFFSVRKRMNTFLHQVMLESEAVVSSGFFGRLQEQCFKYVSWFFVGQIYVQGQTVKIPIGGRDADFVNSYIIIFKPVSYKTFNG